MSKEPKRLLKVFLCHASGDKPQVHILYKRLVVEGVDAWLDQEKILPGQDWQVEIPRAVKDADVVVICLSNKSITKEGYIQKEIRFALDSADEKPQGTIFLIPARLEDCLVPNELSRWQWVDIYDDNGFVKLLRSLKLRADKVGAVVEQSLYVEEDEEIDRRLDQLYTEGLAAFYTEEWDKACQRFQSILSERPNHKNATDKLEEAERQRDLSKLYAQSLDAYKSENWQIAVKNLEELSQKYTDYKDSSQLLRDARKQKLLQELYAEAKTLHTAQKWRAVLKVFEQIMVVDSVFLDPDGLLPSAQREVAELKRLAELNDLYRSAVREMDAGQWYDARKLLEQVHKAQTGFLETEKLLRKVEVEITKTEMRISRNNQINTLYEQAHGFIRSKNWRKALEKLEEIQKLDDQFVDKDGIFEKAKVELVLEEQEAQKQNNLAAMYVDTVRLLKEEKYRETLEKWQEIVAIDSRYPDRQSVQKTARKKLTESTAMHSSRGPSRWRLIIRGGIIVIIALVFLAGGVKSSIGASLVELFTASTLSPTSTKIVSTPTLWISTETQVAPTIAYLADLKPVSSEIGHFSLGVGKYSFTEGTAIFGQPLKANSVAYPYGLFAHAPSELVYSLKKKYTSFSSVIYLDGYSECAGLARFVVLLDGKEIYRSQSLTYTNPNKPVDILSIRIDGGDMLTLKTDSLGNPDCDWTVWGDPYLTQ